MPRKKRPSLHTPKYDWEDRWYVLDYHGQRIVFYGRSALAKALNRQPVTIRSWELSGIICHPPQRHPTNRRWLYTESQILDMVRLATEEGVIDPSNREPFSTRFRQQAWGILSRKPHERSHYADRP